MGFSLTNFKKWVEGRNGKIFVDEEKFLIKSVVPLQVGEILVKTRRGFRGNVIGLSKMTEGRLVVFPPNAEVQENRVLGCRVVKETSNAVIALPLLYQDYTLVEEGEYEGFVLRIRWVPPYAV